MLKQLKAQKVAIISDIHGNADALEWALRKVALDPVEITVFLGDFLTYGCQPCEVLNLLKKYQTSHNCVFIKGNHDQFYFDIKNKLNPYIYPVPEFVRESIEWTNQEIAEIDLEFMFDWVTSYELGDIYLSHANPYQYGNWAYVDSIEQYIAASNKIMSMGKSIGVFGHSHRAKIIGVTNGECWEPENNKHIVLHEDDCLLLNPGSIGQARGQGTSYMMVSVFNHCISVEKINIDIDYSNAINLIGQSTMSVSTKEKLISFLRS